MNSSTFKSSCFTLKKNYTYFEFDIKDIGIFKGTYEDLFNEINKTHMKKLFNTESWTIGNLYMISRPNLIKRNPNHIIFHILSKFRV